MQELANGEVTRSVTLPVEVEAAQVDATFENGVLRLWQAKAAAAMPRKIEIRTVEREAIPAESKATSSKINPIQRQRDRAVARSRFDCPCRICRLVDRVFGFRVEEMHLVRW